jgi:hypothetical protein
MRSTLPPQSLIRTPISAAAYDALAASSMRLLVMGAQRSPQGEYAILLDEVTLNRLTAATGPSEDFSDVMIRMAKAEAKASGRLSLASVRLSPQTPAIYRH